MNIKNKLQSILPFLQSGRMPYIATIVHILVGTVWVYTSPRSNLAFIVLLTSLFTLYYLRSHPTFKMVAAGLLAFVIMPVLGARNIFYLEIIFQIAIYFYNMLRSNG